MPQTEMYALFRSTEEYCDCPIFLGIYSTKDKAKEAKEAYNEKLKPWSIFSKGLEFYISLYKLDGPATDEDREEEII